MIIIFLESVQHAYSHITTPLTHWVTSFGVEKSTRCDMLSTRIITLLGRTAVHARRTAHRNSDTVKAESSMSRIQTPILFQTCSMGFMSGLHTDLCILLNQTSSRVTCCIKRGIVPDMHKVLSRNPLSPRKAFYRREAWCSIGGCRLHPVPPVHFTHHCEWHPIPWLRGQGYCLWVGCAHLSISALACDTYEHNHHCETAWSETHH